MFPLRAELAQVLQVLAELPSWAEVHEPFGKEHEVWLEIVNRHVLRNLSSIIGGLMTRTLEVQKDGFRVAASELNALLQPDTWVTKLPFRVIYRLDTM